MIIGMDIGKYQTRVVYSPMAMFSFKSKLYTYYDLWMTDRLEKLDFIVEFEGQKYIGGNLGDREGEIPIQFKNASKAHNTTLINALAGLHQLNDDRFKIVVGSPISQRSDEEKQSIKKMLKGKHSISINGIKKDIYIEQVEVSPEGAASFWGEHVNHLSLQGLDFGSTTTNYFVFERKSFIGKHSDTFPYGAENSLTNDPLGLMTAIHSQLINKFERNRPTIVLGGKAEDMFPYVKKFYPNAFLASDPIFATARGFYMIARAIYND